MTYNKEFDNKDIHYRYIKSIDSRINNATSFNQLSLYWSEICNVNKLLNKYLKELYVCFADTAYRLDWLKANCALTISEDAIEELKMQNLEIAFDLWKASMNN